MYSVISGLKPLGYSFEMELKKPIPLAKGSRASISRKCLLDRTCGREVEAAHFEMLGFLQAISYGILEV